MATEVIQSLFKVKTSSVPDISKIPPEAGAITLNEADGKIYICDIEGWKELTGTAI